MDDSDPFDDWQQPRCPECGTVLTSLRRGFQCRTCEIVYIDNMPSRTVSRKRTDH